MEVDLLLTHDDMEGAVIVLVLVTHSTASGDEASGALCHCVMTLMTAMDAVDSGRRHDGHGSADVSAQTDSPTDTRVLSCWAELRPTRKPWDELRYVHPLVSI